MVNMEPEDICIKVHTQFLPDQFDDSDDKYAFAYRITIINNGNKAAKLLRRYWLITDGNGEKTEVSGEGVVGEQPTIEPGKHYQYTSGAVLETPVGTMQGHYEFVDDSESVFKAPIEVFRLAVNNAVN